MLVLSVIVATAVVPKLVGLVYDPTDMYMAIEQNTLYHLKHDSELRIMVCIHNQDNIPTIMNLLEVSNPTRDSPIVVIAMQLVELVGRAMPILLAHGEQPAASRALEPNLSKSNHIINALRHYELLHEDCTKLKSFTTVSHFDTMHDDIVQVISERHVTVVIMPFHKQWAIDGAVGTVSRQVQSLNINVLSKAPCSVGILVDRGILKGSLSIINARSDYHVVVLFFGGDDDMEALTYGARMASHERVLFTLVRFLLPEFDSRSMKHESEYINTVRKVNGSSERFAYFEEEIRDGVRLASVMREILADDTFDLILVGKHHPESEIMWSLEAWSECPELGVVGDMVSSMDFGSTASVLVVQQHRVAGDVMGNVRRRVEDQQVMPDTPPAGRINEHIVAMFGANDGRHPS